ncbi:hypothetical protein ACIQVT_11775 [Streptomyces sp. NPDC100445]|uniref:hypothetical protein n=1 Tax=Streptomyces sp. NPDC100445 TaxID=3366102 RepID=UPI0037F6EF19
MTVAGSGSTTARTDDPLYQQGIGNGNQPGQVVLQWAVPDTVTLMLTVQYVEHPSGDLREDKYNGTLSLDGQMLTFGNGNVRVTVSGSQSVAWVPVGSSDHYSLSPGGPPDVTLTRGGEVGYPGVQMHADGPDPVVPEHVQVTLPAGRGLEFVAESNSMYQLTVQDAQGNTVAYDGTLSADGQTLTFEAVDLALSAAGAQSAAWVAVKASGGAALEQTDLSFRVGGRSSVSTPIDVVNP